MNPHFQNVVKQRLKIYFDVKGLILNPGTKTGTLYIFKIVYLKVKEIFFKDTHFSIRLFNREAPQAKGDHLRNVLRQ